MKVALFTSVYPPRIGGPSTQARQLALTLAEAGHEPFVITFGERGGKVYDERIPVYYLRSFNGAFWGPARQYTNFLFRLAVILLSERPAVFHYLSACDYGCGPAGLVARLLRVPRVAKFAGDLVWEVLSTKGLTNYSYPEIHKSSRTARLLATWQRFALRQYDIVWATSDFQKQILTGVVRIPVGKIYRMPNYVNATAVRRQVNSSLLLTFLCVSRFEPWKRLEDVVLAFARISDSSLRLRLVGGENPMMERKLGKLVSEAGVSKLVEFTGSVSPLEVKNEFAKADIFVSASVYEPFGIVFIEAMEAGLPIIATNVGGIPEVVRDSKTGILVPPRRVDLLATEMRRLARDPELRNRMGVAGQKRAQRFSLSEHLDDVLRLYSVAINSR